MDKNYKQKAKDFFRKEGFYVVLFVCLCIITTVAAIAIKKAKDSESQAKIEENNNKEISINVDDKSVNNEVQNAQRVEKTQSEAETKEVVAKTEVKFTNPLEGDLVREYTYPKPVKINENDLRTISGIDIKSTVGTDVKVAAEGVVESAGKGNVDEGVMVIIKHANGIKTKYCYLDSNLLVKQGEKVTSGAVIGKVGKAPAILDKDEAGVCLNLQVFNANNEQVDPLKYFSYKSKK
jgi:murein DD-endopeptidase MepM/ murein hydrolase activator NlpD